jgi:hypothetical protein
MATHHCIKGIPLVKFQTEERIRQLQSGKMHMKSLKWYREYAQSSASIGDDYEGMFHINKATIYVTPLESSESATIEDINNGLMMTKHMNDFVFCMFGIKPNADNFQFTDEQKREMLSFGDTALLITDFEQFCKRIQDALRSAAVPLADIHHGFVLYYDENVDSVNLLCSLISGMHNIAFQKRNRYAYQQEYRFLIPSDGRSEDFFELQIGDISDISKVYKSSQILNSFVIYGGSPR